VTTTKQPTRVGNIVADLESLAFPVDQLVEMPGNPRRGDVDAVARSYSTFGQRKPIVARREGDGAIVLAGNHQLKAARKLGWSHIAVVFVEDDDLTARAFSLADNRTAELGDYDEDLLAEMISYIADDKELLAATGYSPEDIEKLVDGVEQMGDDMADRLESAWSVVIACRDEAEQVVLLKRFTEEGFQVKALVG